MKLKHLEFIQGIITRMANNSFMLKGWAVTLVAGIFALSSKDSDQLYSIISIIPVIAFWGLDSYYLLQERLYRSLYNKVKDLEENSIDFSLKTSYDKFPFKENRYSCCLFSKTELWFYLPLFLVCLAVIIFVNIDNIQICIKNIINS